MICLNNIIILLERWPTCTYTMELDAGGDDTNTNTINTTFHTLPTKRIHVLL